MFVGIKLTIILRAQSRSFLKPSVKTAEIHESAFKTKLLYTYIVINQ